MTVTEPNIARLEQIVDSLPAADKALFRRIYAVITMGGGLRLPPSMQPWVVQQFGSVDAVTRQQIVRVANKVTGEEAIFNWLRNLRPIEPKGRDDLETRLRRASRQDTFHLPEKSTPEDLFGRVVGKHCITASNVAKYDGLHGLVIFNDFNPLRFSREQVVDYLDVGWEWARRAQVIEPSARYFLFIWNCLWRAGASIYHGHAQVILTRDRHYAKIEGLRRAALDYRQEHGRDYFEDLFLAHRSLGCAIEKEGVKILAHLTPFKDNEVMLMAGELNLSLKERVYEVLAFLRDELKVTSFNLSLVTPPLAATEESWEGFPVIVRVVDRGDPDSQASDVGAIEIYAASVVASDPFTLTRKLRQYLS